MTDLYVRRGEPPTVRKRAIYILMLLLVAGLAVFGLRHGCARRQAPEAVDTEPERDLLDIGRLPEAPAPSPTAPAPTPETPARTRTPAAPPATPATAPAATRPAPTAASVTPQFSEARRLFDEGQFQAARELCQQLLEQNLDPATRDQVIDLLGKAGMELLLTPRPMPEKIDYTVQSGDSLARLARRFNTTVELLQKSNNIRGSLIRIGDRLRIFQGEFSVKVNKTTNILDLYLDGKLFKRYRVGTGEYARTPVGEFTITDRIPQPTWWRPDGKAIPFGDPENELGTHWLSLDIRGYGLHGTWEPETIGQQASAGCVRMLNEEIEELFTILPVGTPVVIVD